MAESQRPRVWPWVLFGGAAFFMLIVGVLVLVGLATQYDHRAGFTGFGDKIGVVDLEGVIIQPDTVVKQLKEFSDDDSIKAIILHINTPGGGAAASQEIYEEVRRV